MVDKIKTIEVKESREIHIPLEWKEKLGIGFFSYAQLTLVDDRIAIHKPTAAGVEYKAACKISDDSYIRRIDIIGIRIPSQLFKPLGINSGDKVDLILEENCISIRKNTDIESLPIDTEPPEPIMAFCCVCGNLLYTEGLVKIAKKHICHECIETVKTL